MRLHKILAKWGLASRRKIEQLILAGKVKVNNLPFTEVSKDIDENTIETVEIDGKLYKKPISIKTFVLVFNKPSNVLSTMYDPFNRKTLKDYFVSFMNKHKVRLFPVGRLDYDTTGLLLMTNNGDLAYKLMHPKFMIEKEYLVKFWGKPLSKEEIIKIEKGDLILEDGKIAPCKLLVIDKNCCKIILHEGRKREIKRIFAALGRKVVKLQRVRFGPIKLGALKIGSFRLLTKDELMNLFNLVNRKL